MPDWLPDNLAELVVFTPVRIVLLIIAAFVLQRVLHRLINRSVRRAIDRPLSSRNQLTQKVIDATTVSAERRKQRLSALGSLAQSTADLRDLRRCHPDDLGRAGIQHHHDPGGHDGHRRDRCVRPAEHREGPRLGRLHAGRGPARRRRLRRHGDGLWRGRGHWTAGHRTAGQGRHRLVRP